jgi:tetratricopeptide (TPR) repeat protein
MKRAFLTIMLFLAAAVASGASSFEQANRQFSDGDIAGAAALYQEILDSDGPNAAVLFNLGNCEQRLGNFGPAILAYERARLLTPRDPDLSANLALARKAAAVFEEPSPHPRLHAVLNYLSLNEWSWLVAGSALFLGALAVACGLVRLPRRWMNLSVRIATGVAVVMIFAGAAALYLRRDEGNRGVVLSDRANVRLSPFEKAESLGSPGPGRIVHLLKSDGAYHFVEVPGTKLQGWMSDKDVGIIASKP